MGGGQLCVCMCGRAVMSVEREAKKKRRVRKATWKSASGMLSWLKRRKKFCQRREKAAVSMLGGRKRQRDYWP